MKKKVKWLLVIILILMIFYMFLKNSFYKIYFENKFEKITYDNFTITTYVNHKLNAKTYVKGNRVLSEYYSEDGANHTNIFSNYDNKKVYFYTTPYNREEVEILDMEDGQMKPLVMQTIVDIMNDKNAKFQSIEKVHDNKKQNGHYVLKFVDKQTNNVTTMILNSNTYVLEKSILFMPESNSILIEEYTYNFNENVDDNIFPNID